MKAIERLKSKMATSTNAATKVLDAASSAAALAGATSPIEYDPEQTIDGVRLSDIAKMSPHDAQKVIHDSIISSVAALADATSPIEYKSMQDDIDRMTKELEALRNGAAPATDIDSDTNKQFNISYNFLMSAMSIFNMNFMLNEIANGEKSKNCKIAFFKMHPSCRSQGQDETLINVKKLFRNLHWKHMAGHFIWVYFASLITTFTFIKSIANYV
jgi:hypothetical protein